MAEGSNVEIAHDLAGHSHDDTPAPGWHRLLEVAEVLILAVVAVATAWSGYQAAKWDGRQTVLYGESNRDRFAADTASTLGGQELVANVGLFTSWLQAHTAGNADLERILEKRMTPDYRVAFDAWLATNPFANANAPPGPSAMPAYENPFTAEAKQRNDRASAAFDDGTHARETGEKYVRNTVIFAVVLFIVAIAQRMKDRTLRLSTNAISAVLLVYALLSTIRLHRL